MAKASLQESHLRPMNLSYMAWFLALNLAWGLNLGMLAGLHLGSAPGSAEGHLYWRHSLTESMTSW